MEDDILFLKFILVFVFLLFAMIGVAVFVVVEDLYDMKENEEKYGKEISNLEAECLEFCKPGKYWYYQGDCVFGQKTFYVVD